MDACHVTQPIVSMQIQTGGAGVRLLEAARCVNRNRADDSGSGLGRLRSRVHELSLVTHRSFLKCKLIQTLKQKRLAHRPGKLIGDEVSTKTTPAGCTNLNGYSLPESFFV